MEKIKLKKNEWNLDPDYRLGKPGGFGEVFNGNGEIGEVAIKRLKIDAEQAAHRELDVVKNLSEKDLNYIVPIYDYGQDSESERYYIVMPRCERNLQDYIENNDIDVKESINILLTILYGLKEIPELAHRDLKPANILYHNNKWKIADFGIAKFVEDSTSLETLRSCLTPLYAAPEQWRHERPTQSTDIYAVGCIAHTLLKESPPFQGDNDYLREAHLNSSPGSIETLPHAARAIVTHMLRKPQMVRPNIDRCIDVLENSITELDNNPNVDEGSNIAVAAEAVSRQKALEETETIKREEEERIIEEIYQDSTKTLLEIRKHLFDEIKSHCQEIVENSSRDDYISVGNARFYLASAEIRGFTNSFEKIYPKFNQWGAHQKRSNWEFITLSGIALEQRVAHEEYIHSASLIYGRPNENSDYRWYEMSFFKPLSTNDPSRVPYHLNYPREIDEVLSTGMGVQALAHDPVLIDGEAENKFVKYWIEHFSQAMQGKLSAPRSLPINR